MKGTKEYVTVDSQGHGNCLWKLLTDSQSITTVADLYAYLKNYILFDYIWKVQVYCKSILASLNIQQLTGLCKFANS